MCWERAQRLPGGAAPLDAFVKKISHTGTAKGAESVRRLLLGWGKIPFSETEKKKNPFPIY